jgi:hypothetical protein
VSRPRRRGDRERGVAEPPGDPRLSAFRLLPWPPLYSALGQTGREAESRDASDQIDECVEGRRPVPDVRAIDDRDHEHAGRHAERKTSENEREQESPRLWVGQERVNRRKARRRQRVRQGQDEHVDAHGWIIMGIKGLSLAPP